jgi:hypothetical protein
MLGRGDRTSAFHRNVTVGYRPSRESKTSSIFARQQSATDETERRNTAMSLQNLKARVQELEAKLAGRSSGIITVKLLDGSTREISENRIMPLCDEACALAQKFGMNSVPFEALVDPNLQAILKMRSSNEDGGLLRIAQLALLGPAYEASPED